VQQKLVQMTRLFLFSWVCTLPLVLLVDYRLWSSMLIVILVTFGFVGIEYVSMALDDPFGDDTNDVRVMLVFLNSTVMMFLLVLVVDGSREY
jgi:predicted membrane chloride channel (bestrophin family)